MGVTHGKKRDLQQFPARNETQVNSPAPVMQTHHAEHPDQFPDLHALPSDLQCEVEQSSDLIQPQRPVNPVIASRSHQELHKELRLTHKRRLSQEGKTELQRVLERRKWEQKMKASREEEAKRSRSPLQQELLKRQERLKNLEREEKIKEEEPEFLQVKEKLRRTPSQDAGEKQVGQISR